MEARLLKVKDAAVYLSLSKSTLYNLIKAQKIPYVRLTEKRVAFREADLHIWLEQRAYKSGDVWQRPWQ